MFISTVQGEEVERMATTARSIIDRTTIMAQPWTPLRDQRGVRQKVLWRDLRARSYAGLMRLDPGARILEHVHHDVVHHVWVVDGVCGMGGEALGPGSYSFVPAGVMHELLEVGLEGCTVFYLSVPTGAHEPAN